MNSCHFQTAIICGYIFNYLAYCKWVFEMQHFKKEVCGLARTKRLGFFFFFSSQILKLGNRHLENLMLLTYVACEVVLGTVHIHHIIILDFCQFRHLHCTLIGFVMRIIYCSCELPPKLIFCGCQPTSWGFR